MISDGVVNNVSIVKESDDSDTKLKVYKAYDPVFTLGFKCVLYAYM